MTSSSSLPNIVAEYARSGNVVVCRKCSQNIKSEKLMLGFKDSVDEWHHFDCFFQLELGLVNVDSIEGFLQLQENDKEKLKAMASEVSKSSTKGDFEKEDSSDETYVLNYRSHIAENMYKLARLGVDGLAKKMGVEVSVVRDGVEEYFRQEKINRSEEVHNIFRLRKGNEEKKEENKEEDKEAKPLYRDILLLEHQLFRTLNYMSLTKNRTLSEISSICGIPIETQMHYISLYIEFRKYLGYGDHGDGDEVSDANSQAIPDPKEEMDAPRETTHPNQPAKSNVRFGGEAEGTISARFEADRSTDH